MKTIMTILWSLVFLKLMFFWLWLWQLKEYHFGRFRAHFETQAVKKVLSSFWRLKYPQFTKKMLLLLLAGVALEGVNLFYIFSLPASRLYMRLFVMIILVPVSVSLIVLIFQIPTVFLRNRLLKKAQKRREQFKNLIVVGITGSYGKTSTKEFLAAILSQKFKVLKTEKHINSEIGIAQTVLRDLKPEHQIFVVEIGAYEKGKIKQVCDMVQPRIGILTGINEQHMSTFGSQENIIKGKYELIEALPEDGLAIFNGSNKYCRELYQKTNIPKKLVEVKDDKLLSENLAMAQTAAAASGMNQEEIALASKGLKLQPQVKQGNNGLNIIDSSYSANPAGVVAHLDYLKSFTGRKIIIMPCLIELGKVSKRVHQRIGQKIGKVCDLAIIITEDRFKYLKQGAVRSGMDSEHILLLEKPDKILEKIKATTAAGDVVLLESRVPEQVIRGLVKNAD